MVAFKSFRYDKEEPLAIFATPLSLPLVQTLFTKKVTDTSNLTSLKAIPYTQKSIFRHYMDVFIYF